MSAAVQPLQPVDLTAFSPVVCCRFAEKKEQREQRDEAREDLEPSRADALVYPRPHPGTRMHVAAVGSSCKAATEEDFRDYSLNADPVRPRLHDALPFARMQGHHSQADEPESGDIDAGVYCPRCASVLHLSREE